jgi:hypothetical protein
MVIVRQIIFVVVYAEDAARTMDKPLDRCARLYSMDGGCEDPGYGCPFWNREQTGIKERFCGKHIPMIASKPAQTKSLIVPKPVKGEQEDNSCTASRSDS